MLPPPVIHSSKLLCFAVNDADVVFTDKISLYVSSEAGELVRLAEVPNIAICQPYNEISEILLFFCDENWEPKGTIPFSSIEEAKIRAERGYAGVNSKWHNSGYSHSEIEEFLRTEYEVDPASRWWEMVCSFCNKTESEDLTIFQAPKASICSKYVASFYSNIKEQNT